jgi:hypothetical protein
MALLYRPTKAMARVLTAKSWTFIEWQSGGMKKGTPGIHVHRTAPP